MLKYYEEPEYRINSNRVLITRDPYMLNVFDFIENTAGLIELNYLIRGETGTGKELIARAMHFNTHDGNTRGEFVTLNIASVPDTLLESILFGHEKGAFTDAKKLKSGLAKKADLGSLFFDEVGDMSLKAQATLLRFIEEGEFTKLGSTEKETVKLRVIAATNKDLDKMIEEGTFRRDLYERLSTIPIHLPSLRERRDDIPDISIYLINKYSRLYQRENKGFSIKALKKLKGADYEGNVRGLSNVIKRAIILAKGEVIKVEHLTFSEKEFSEYLKKQVPDIALESDYRKEDTELIRINLMPREKDWIKDGVIFKMLSEFTFSDKESISRAALINLLEEKKIFGRDFKSRLHKNFGMWITPYDLGIIYPNGGPNKERMLFDIKKGSIHRHLQTEFGVYTLSNLKGFKDSYQYGPTIAGKIKNAGLPILNEAFPMVMIIKPNNVNLLLKKPFDSRDHPIYADISEQYHAFKAGPN